MAAGRHMGDMLIWHSWSDFKYNLRRQRELKVVYVCSSRPGFDSAAPVHHGDDPAASATIYNGM